MLKMIYSAGRVSMVAFALKLKGKNINSGVLWVKWACSWVSLAVLAAFKE